MPTGFDDPGPRLGPRGNALCELEHDRNRPHRLGEAAGARRLLADAAAAQRHGLVAEPRLLTADADLCEHERRTVEGGVELGRAENAPRKPVALEHPGSECANDLEPLGVDVVQCELVHVEPRKLRDELGRVRRACADHGELHPFTPVSVTPSTKARCARKKRRITGAITIKVAAMTRFHCTW